MKKKIKFLLLLSLMHVQCFPQSIKFLEFNNLPLFDSEIEISSICYQDDLFYLPAERRDSIFVVKIEGDTIKLNTTIQIKGLDSKAEIEASFINAGTIFLVDEYNAKIYAGDLSSGEAKSVAVKGLEMEDFNCSKDQKGNDFGFEGVTCNPDKKLVYLLREKKQKKIRVIYLSSN